MATIATSCGIIALIFGGCCSNVYALEAILKRDPESGLLVTLMQFVITALAALPTQYDPNSRFFLKKTAAPIRKWAMSALMFFAVNMLNNWAFAFNISVPVHIILRSFGSVTTMGAGWVRGKRYSRIQVISVLLLTFGVILSAWADALSKGNRMDTADIKVTDTSFEMGLLILLVAQILSAFMGIYVQETFNEYGKAWDENLFYSHFFSLPLFIPLQSSLMTQYATLGSSAPMAIPPSIALTMPFFLQKILLHLPRSVFMLFLNAITQLLCISGVNLLSANTSAVTVTIVLNIRKLVSFMLSIWLFGNKMSGLMMLGAFVVFGSGALYGWETSIGIPRRRAKGRPKVAGKKEL
ncbi:UAA transporter [Eremomyces bilateralis CBS 781.70]|uniref:UAA transporter n=1 Tax=Eremomyces bilateralis CBS 781.70 TaxID=1392243 RepID=A0A6G1G301_9PEZI|nr:UAA transporter [Eremomyces bilateralis CBS 781.70]KAF1812434.1 UAA transporter [Eremomyces bilateralis CBS 781.70]